MPSSAHRSARRDSFARGSAARLVSWRDTCPQPVQRQRRIVISNVVGRHPSGFVRQPPGHAVARRSLASAAATLPGELVGLDDPAGQHRTTGLESLTHDLQAEFVKPAERAQVGGQEGSVRHVAPIGLRGMSRCRHAYRVD